MRAPVHDEGHDTDDGDLVLTRTTSLEHLLCARHWGERSISSPPSGLLRQKSLHGYPHEGSVLKAGTQQNRGILGLLGG